MKRLLLLLFLASTPAYATDFYTATSPVGSDTTNNCQNIAAPCNLSNGVANEFAQIGADGSDDTLYLCAGACNGSGSANIGVGITGIQWPTGTSGHPFTFRTYSGETIVFQPSGTLTGIEISTVSYLYVQDIVFDGVNMGNPAHYASKLLSIGATSYSHFTNLEVKNAPCAGIIVGSGVPGVYSTYNEFVGLSVHDNGCLHYYQSNGADYNLIDDSVFDTTIYRHTTVVDESTGEGVQFQDAGWDSPPRDVAGHTTLRNSIIRNSAGDGLTLHNSPNNTIFNNLIYSNYYAGILTWSTQGGQQIYHNTIYGNGEKGLRIYNDDTLTAKNNIVYGNSSADISNETCTSCTISDNLTGNPLFTSAGTGDFTLTSMSPAIDNVDCISTTDSLGNTIVASDVTGLSRPQGNKCDNGAYERLTASPNVRTTRSTPNPYTFTGAAAVLSGSDFAQVGAGGLTCNLDGSGHFVGSASSIDGCLTRELTGSYGTQNQFCQVEIVVVPTANDGSDIVGCDVMTTGGNGYGFEISYYMGVLYAYIGPYSAGVRNPVSVAYTGSTSWSIGDTLSGERNSATGQMWMLQNSTVILNPADTTYSSGLKPGVVAAGAGKGDNGVFGEINVPTGGETIVVTGPGTGTVCVSGSPCQISWTSTNLTGTFDCGYLIGGNYYSVATPAYNASPISWTVNAPASTSAQVRCKQGAFSGDGNTFTIYGTKAVFK